MRTYAWPVIMLWLLLGLNACAGRDEQAVRHRVIAELIERDHVPESHIQVQGVQIESRQKAVVKAKVLGHGGRAGAWERLRCELIRERDRWVIRDIEPENANRK